MFEYTEVGEMGRAVESLGAGRVVMIGLGRAVSALPMSFVNRWSVLDIGSEIL